MEDDEFGDLYTDVLKPFTAATSSSTPIPIRPIDLNLRQHNPNDQILKPVNDFDPNSAIEPILPNEDGKEFNFDIEADDNEDEQQQQPVIPGLGGGDHIQGQGGQYWDEDSDSEDDLQIVLNDNNHGSMAAIMERGGGGMEGYDVVDGNEEVPLVVTGDDDAQIQAVGLGEDAGQAADGEGKEGADKNNYNVSTAAGGLVVPPKLAYGNVGYHHQFHSQFKYVRPGAATMPGPGAPPGQIRPQANVPPMAGRGRGEWRPMGIRGASPMQKGFFGAPWGNNIAGRGFGAGLDFTLPSHKTIFEVDIDSFEEKPWKYPGVDVTDFFNFGLNEESWKDYCKQLEQRRLETTMQSKIRVYESGRTEKDYDPDLPPELAAAAGVHEISTGNANLGKSNIGQTDVAKGSFHMRPPLPTGRAIQVEVGMGDRLPSVDTRPLRMRDSDDIIVIVPQGSVDDDDSSKIGAEEQGESREDIRKDHMTDDDVAPMDAEYFDSFSVPYNGQSRKTHFMGPGHDYIPEGKRILPFPPGPPIGYRPGFRGQAPIYPGGDFGVPLNERRNKEKSLHLSPDQSKRDKRFHHIRDDESVESIDAKNSPELSSPALSKDVQELSADNKLAMIQESVVGDGSPEIDKDEITTTKNGNSRHSVKKQKTSPQLDNEEDSKAARSSENSKARSGSSRDHQKSRDSSGEEEVVLDGRSRKPDETQNLRRKDPQIMEINRVPMIKGRNNDPYPYREMDPSLSHHPQTKTGNFDRRKERDSSEVSWQRREEDPYSRKSKTEVGSRHKGKLRENERSDKDEHIYSRKQLDNGNYRAARYEEKDSLPRQRERDDNSRSRFEIMDEYHNKRRKGEEYFRRDHAEKEEILHRETSSRRKRERDGGFDSQKRDERSRLGDSFVDRQSVRQKDDWHKLKKSHEENLPKWERDDVRKRRGSEEKAYVGHARAKDEYKGSGKGYQVKDMAGHGEQTKRRDRAEDGSSSYHKVREDAQKNADRKSTQGKLSVRNDRADNNSESHQAYDKKQKETSRKNKDFEGGDGNSLTSSKRNQGDRSGQTSQMGLKDGSANEMLVASRKRSDEEKQDSRRGRSKFERWEEKDEVGPLSSEPVKAMEGVEEKNVGTTKDNEETKLVEDNKQLDDTVEKLKKRSERFKLPIDKDALVIKKVENEAPPPAKNETRVDSEIKPERPARKRRWVGN
ncbi:hypothetical protein ACFE04_003059 [Oxalis oulophora]